MFTVKVDYPGQVLYFKTDTLANAEWLIAQLNHGPNAEWIHASLL